MHRAGKRACFSVATNVLSILQSSLFSGCRYSKPSGLRPARLSNSLYETGSFFVFAFCRPLPSNQPRQNHPDFLQSAGDCCIDAARRLSSAVEHIELPYERKSRIHARHVPLQEESDGGVFHSRRFKRDWLIRLAI